MKKTVSLEKIERRNYEINIEGLMIEIRNLDKDSGLDFQKLKITGKVKNENEAMEIAQKYISDLEEETAEYSDIAKAFIPSTITEFRMDMDSYYGEKNDFLGEIANKIIKSFKNEIEKEIKVFISTDNETNYISLNEGDFKMEIEGNSFEITDGYIEIKSGSYELEKMVKNLGNVDRYFSEATQGAFAGIETGFFS